MPSDTSASSSFRRSSVATRQRSPATTFPRGSSDHNVALLRGVPAIAVGATVGRNAHAPREIADADPLEPATLEGALIAGKIMCYAQGFDLLSRAGSVYGWTLPMAEVAKVWREGCIIRSAMPRCSRRAPSSKPSAAAT